MNNITVGTIVRGWYVRRGIKGLPADVPDGDAGLYVITSLAYKHWFTARPCTADGTAIGKKRRFDKFFGNGNYKLHDYWFEIPA